MQPVRPRRHLATPYLVCLFLIVLATLPVTGLRAEMVDKVVAVVNNDVITLSELEAEGEVTFRKIASTTPPEQLSARMEAVRAKILDTMIDKRLIAQKAKEKNISVSEKEVDDAIDNVLQRTRMSRDQLLQRLNQSGIDMEIYRSTLRSQLLQQKLLGSDVSTKIVITEEMMRDYYDNHNVPQQPVPSARVDGSNGYYLLQIGCTWRQVTKEEARERAEKLRSMALAGQDFRELARKYSDLPSKVDGGDIGTLKLADMAADMRTSISGLGAGDISGIIETSAGFQFFKVLSGGAGQGPVDKEKAFAKAPFEEVKDSIHQELFELEMKKAYSDWVEKLKGQAYIQKL